MASFTTVLASVFLLMASEINGRGAFRKMFPEHYPPMIKNGVDPGEPVYLTPYIEKGDYDTAQKMSLVGPLKGTTIKSYSGFITVNKTYNSNMFFWFFPAQKNPADAPVVLWLQGGPGGSSLFGLFVENGHSITRNKMVLLENDTFLTELTKLFQKGKSSGSLTLTMKRYDGRTKPKPRTGNIPEPNEYKCLLRATLGNKKLSTVVDHKDVNRFQMAYSNLLKGNMDGLKKKDKKSTTKAKSKATQ